MFLTMENRRITPNSCFEKQYHLSYMETQTKNEIFVKNRSVYLNNTDCNAVRLNTTEIPPFFLAL